jgi:hypothetical protein
MRLEVHSEAGAEFLHAVSFYTAQVPGLGLRFIAEIERRQKVTLEEIHGWRQVPLAFQHGA